VLRFCRILGAAVLGVLGVAALTPASQELAARYAERPELEPSDAIVVLGGGVMHGSLGDPSLQRVMQGIRLQRRGLAPVLVFTGEAPPVGPSEPEIRARFARDLGVPPAAIATVSATTTREEAIGAAALLRPRGVRSVLLVSGSLHLVRARGVFEREGFQVRPAPADNSYTRGSVARERLDVTRALVRELAGWLYYRLAGYL
jgi:uncharacterized SAM-binding protein YcdF (DUF218 family)